MISDKLYELAFKYKKTKLWEILYDMQLFAVKLSDGRIGYVSIMGAAGEHCALALYIGEDGFNSFRTLAETDGFALTPFEFQERLLQQNCLQCAFESRDELSDEEREEVKQYARAHGIRIAGRNAYPQFVKYQPNRCPWRLQTDREQEDLCEALAAALEVAGMLKGEAQKTIALRKIDRETKEVPMLVLQNGAYVLEKAGLPEEKPKEWPTPKAQNDIGIANLKKAKRAGVWECELIRFLDPILDDSEEIPFFPMILLAVEASKNYLLNVPPAKHYEEHPEELLNLFMDAFLKEGICPREIKVRDERTYVFVKEFCRRLKIKLSMEKKLPVLEEAEYDFFEHFGKSEKEEIEDLIAMLDDLLRMDKQQLELLPVELMEHLKLLAEEEMLPEEIETRLDQLFNGKNAGKSRREKSGIHVVKTAPKESYVISVSLGAGCYRHIQISGGSTLLELHSAILEAFQFDDDHAHAFFMDNTKWSDRDSYYMRGVEDGRRTTDRYRLHQAGLCRGKQFKYIFDFGDEWTFQCKVLKVLEEGTEQPTVIRSKGEAPPQYYDWEDE